KGAHKEEQEVNEENCIYKERRYGTFSRSVLIPVHVKSDKAEAVFEDGILTLTLSFSKAWHSDKQNKSS
ncbi:MAG: Hsp20/alpha crystallin family protein, partial [Dehalococcoidia bacterium]|nr:Hsp20/alpha crystallin family protein [Dehalococcoidia bacterium]